MNTKDIFAERIALLRSEKGITQGTLAEAIGISRQSITLYENRTRVPDIEILSRFSDFFGVTSDYLLGLSDNRTNENAAIGDKLGLSDEAIQELQRYAKNVQETENISTTGMIQKHIAKAKYSRYNGYLKTLNMLILDTRLLSAIDNYIFTKIDPIIANYDYIDDDTSIQTFEQQRIECGQAVNMYHIQKNLIRVWEKTIKQEDTNAKKD